MKLTRLVAAAAGAAVAVSAGPWFDRFLSAPPRVGAAAFQWLASLASVALDGHVWVVATAVGALLTVPLVAWLVCEAVTAPGRSPRTAAVVAALSFGVVGVAAERTAVPLLVCVALAALIWLPRRVAVHACALGAGALTARFALSLARDGALTHGPITVISSVSGAPTIVTFALAAIACGLLLVGALRFAIGRE